MTRSWFSVAPANARRSKPFGRLGGDPLRPGDIFLADENIPETIPEQPTDAVLAGYKRVTRDLFTQILTTFQTLLPPEKAAQFGAISEELKTLVMDKLDAVAQNATAPARDTRRNRFLLRLVLSRLSHLFAGNKAILPRSLTEGIDTYLKKAFGPIIYEELNNEADQILWNLHTGDDRELWDSINKNPPVRRFVDTIFIRILFRFENFANGKKTFITIVDRTMQDKSNVSFNEDHFYAVFEAMFSNLWNEAQNEGQRVRWDFLFGDGTSARIIEILKLGLARWLKRRAGGAALAGKRAATARREDAGR